MGTKEMIPHSGVEGAWGCRRTVILEARGYDPDDTIPKSNDSTSKPNFSFLHSDTSLPLELRGFMLLKHSSRHILFNTITEALFS